MKSPTSEIWRPVPSEPGVFASSEGRILLPPRVAPCPNGGYRVYETKPRLGQKVKKPKRPSDNYRVIMLYSERDGKRQRPRTVHRMVCEAFRGRAPFPDAVVMHIDENPDNNRADNLKWGTQKENLNAPGFKAYCRSRVGEKNPVIIGRARQMEKANG